jgi:FeS assembly protein SufD
LSRPPARERAAGAALALAGFLFIAVATLTPLPNVMYSLPRTCIVCGELGVVDVVNNILLFVPLGAGLTLAGVRRRTAVALCVALTVTVETLQIGVIAGRDAKITTLYTTLGSDVTRADVKCRLNAPGAHVDMLGLYLGERSQHFDHETLQDHSAPHASSNLLFKGAIDDEARSVFRGLIRVHPKAQRTDAYQTNRNLVLSAKARADSLPNLEIQADDVRCSHAATVGQLDEEEIFYLLSRGIPKGEAVRLVVFGFFAEVLDQLPLEGVRGELLRAVERKLARRG